MLKELMLSKMELIDKENITVKQQEEPKKLKLLLELLKFSHLDSQMKLKQLLNLYERFDLNII